MVQKSKVVLSRALYGWGNFNVPEDDREYNIISIDGKPMMSSAVGTIAEMCDYLEGQGYTIINFEIKDKNKIKLIKGINVKKG